MELSIQFELFSGTDLYNLAALREGSLDIVIACMLLAAIVAMIVELSKFLLRRLVYRASIERFIKTQISFATADLKRLKDQRLLPATEGKDDELAERDEVNRFLHELMVDVGTTERDEPEALLLLKEQFHYDLRATLNLPRSLFLKRVENTLQVFLDDPARHGVALFCISTGAPVRDRIGLVSWWRDRKSDEMGIEPLGDERGIDVPDSVVTAQQRIAAAVDRNLDAYQLRLAQSWLDIVRLLALGIGVMLTLWIGRKVSPDISSSVLVVLGVIAGLLSTIVYDLLGRITGSREDAY